MTDKQSDLIAAARLAARLANPKLSGYHVGAAVLGEDGQIHVGYNVETDIHEAIHAEMSAIHKLVGTRCEIMAVAVCCPDVSWFPCGLCRQWIWEYAENADIPIFACNTQDDTILRSTIGELLPHAFRLKAAVVR